jgi:hypothetical protein
MKISETSGIAVLLIGIALLMTSFFDAYLFLTKDISILPLPNLVEAFGKALAPLIDATIRIIYLGVMVWIGSTITMRGITVLLQIKPETKLEMPKKTETIKSEAESKKTKTEAKPKIPKETKTKEEPKNIEEAWEKALQEAKLEVKSA